MFYFSRRKLCSARSSEQRYLIITMTLPSHARYIWPDEIYLEFDGGGGDESEDHEDDEDVEVDGVVAEVEFHLTDHLFVARRSQQRAHRHRSVNRRKVNDLTTAQATTYRLLIRNICLILMKGKPRVYYFAFLYSRDQQTFERYR